MRSLTEREKSLKKESNRHSGIEKYNEWNEKCHGEYNYKVGPSRRKNLLNRRQSFEIIQSEENEVKKMKRSEKYLHGLWDTTKRTFCALSNSKRRERERGAESSFT